MAQPSGYTRREKWSLAATATLLMGAACFSPQPHESIVSGRIVRQPVVLGYIVPSWLFLVGCAIVTGLLWRGFWLFFGLILPREHGTAEKENVNFGHNSNPKPPQDVRESSLQSDPEPIDYTMPVFTQETTAMEFLTADRPDTHQTFPNSDEWLGAMFPFWMAQETWLEEAPLETLEDLIPTVDKILTGPYQGDYSCLVTDLITANYLRGIPTKADLLLLLKRTTNVHVREYLLRNLDEIDEVQ